MVEFVPVLWNSSWLVFSRKLDVSIRLLLLLLLLLLFMAEVVQLEPSVEAGVLRCTPSWFLVGRVWTDDVT